MLVLSRKSREQITIGQDVVITVLSVSGSTVRIGIEAPDSVRVMRTEIVNRPPKSAEPQAVQADPPAAEKAQAGARKGVRRVPRFTVPEPNQFQRQSGPEGLEARGAALGSMLERVRAVRLAGSAC